MVACDCQGGRGGGSGGRSFTKPRSLTASLPLKSYRPAPIGKDRLPTTICQGRAVKLREGGVSI